MYGVIVFLPLLGAIIAGLVSLVSSARRHRPPDPYARSRGPQDGGHDHDHDSPGARAAEWITTALVVVPAILSWVVLFTIGYGEVGLDRVQVMNWIQSGTFTADYALRIDTLTAVMLVVVTTVSALVHLYSIGYMAHDPHRPRFFAYLSLFTFAMLVLVTSDNLIQLFLGWEGVGLASYLLIGFWYRKPEANAAAIKAFIVNRVGDFGFALGIFGIFFLFSSVDFETIFANAPTVAGTTMTFLAWEVDALTIVCVLLFIGAMGKSAQFLLHTWLPDAMEGPTPVSALIHAATMVTAGVFLVARMSPLFEFAPIALAMVVFVGATTAFFAATVGLVQNDIKRVVAYSTCSQLGYMFVALGLGAYSAGIFHLFTHAFFKALLFLGAGSVIHALDGEQDLRRMGGLRSKIPFTYAMMVIGTLALTGFPLTAGFYSKDAIIESAGAGVGPFSGYAFVLLLTAAVMTAFYSWRLIFLAFHGAPRGPSETYDHAHESPPVMTIPLGLLALGSLAAGALFSWAFIGDGYESFWKGALFTGEGNHILEEMHHVPQWIVWSPAIAMAIGLAVAAWFYLVATGLPGRLASALRPLYLFLYNKWYFDELYDRIFVRPALWFGRVFYRGGDGWLIDGFGPDGISARVLDVTRNVVRLQSGYIYHYAFAMLIGAALLITWILFRN